MSKVFCNKPFDHIYVHTNGKFRLCCTTIQDVPSNDNYTLFDASKHSINEYWNSNRIKNIRQNMIAGRETLDCKKCYKQEEQGVQSLRTTERMNEFSKSTKNDGTYTLPATTMQLQMGNICNLKCKMCSQMYSHMNGLELLEIGHEDPDWLHWVKQQGANVNNWTNELGKKQEWYKNVELKNKMFQYISNNIIQLNVIGGEPTLIPEFYELFEYCDSQGTLKDKNITLVTNLTNTNPRMTEWLPKLKRFTIWASIDGLRERTEYIRYPSEWNKIVDSLNFYKKFLPGTKNNITLSPAVQLLNIDQLDDIIKWWLQFAGGELNDNFGFTWLATVWYPLICNPTIAPTDWKLKVADKLNQYKFDPFYDNLIKNLRKEEYSIEQKKNYQRSFIKYNDKQDRFRRVKETWRSLLPDLEQSIMKEIG
jgi:hypothetical protein